MSVYFQIPQTARFIPTSNVFSATFNAPALGQYDFGIAANRGQEVIPLQPNTVYLIERMRAAGTVEEGAYFESVATLPTVIITRSIRDERVYSRPIPLNTYSDGWEVAAWVTSDKIGELLTMTFTGVLNQVAATVGVLTIKVNISLSIFAVDSAWFTAHFRNQLSPTIGQSLRG